LWWRASLPASIPFPFPIPLPNPSLCPGS
jgi:hypothetical protein